MKKTASRILSMFLAMMLVVSNIGIASVSVYAEQQPNAVTVRFTAYDPNSGFLAYDQKITVQEGTAAKYGLSNAAMGTMVGGNDHGVAAGQITALDALIAMHEIKYGDAFNAQTMGTYYGGSASYITRMFGKSGGISFAVNNDLPMGDKSDGYAINECVLNNNDSVYFFMMLDPYWGDYLSFFDRTEVSVCTNSSFTLNLQAFQAMESMWLAPGAPTPEAHSTQTEVADADICLVDPATGEIGETIASTDENGNATLSFTQTGTYCLTAVGMVEGDYDDAPITAPICTVTVTEPSYLESFKFTNGTAASSAEYALTVGDGNEYTLTVPDYCASIGAWATLSEYAPEGSTITAKWVATNGAERTQAITSGKASGQNLSMCINAGCVGNRLQLTVGTQNDSQTYTVDIVRSLSLSALTANACGMEVLFDRDFDREITVYTAPVLDAASKAILCATAYGSEAAGYTLMINGVQVKSGTDVAVSLTGASTKVTICVCAEGCADAVYTLTLVKKDVAEVTFDKTPQDATLVVCDQAGNTVAPTGDKYLLVTGGTYTYTATKYGYVAERQSFTACTEEKTVTLLAAESDPSVDPTTSSAWKNFRNSDANMGITNAATPVSPERTEKKWAVKLGTGWAAAPSVQIIADNALIVMSGTTLYKLSLTDGSTIATATMAGSPSYGYTPPTYAEGMLFVPLGNGTVQAFNAKTLEPLWVYKDVRGGQALSPITYSDGYIYTGFWNGENKVANYVCLSVTDEDITRGDEAKCATWIMPVLGGFYWAGSVAIGDTLIFGTDDGDSGFDGASHLYAVDKYTGTVRSALDIRGDQRSSIAYDAAKGRIYFTTKCGYLYSAAVNAETGAVSDLKGVNYGAQSTATPVVYGDKVYFGTGSGISTSGSSGNFVVADADSLQMLYAVGLLGYPQSSLLLSTAYYEAEGLLYFYSTYNMLPGGISLIKVDPTVNTADGAALTEIYDADGYAQYCIASVICDENGTLYYKNDSANVIAVGKTEAYLSDLVGNVGTLSPAFSGEKLDYTMVVPVGTQKVTLQYSAPAQAKVLFNGKESSEITLTNGTASAEIVVTNGAYSRTYTLSIREVSVDSSLSLLRVNESNSYSSSIKALTPEFSSTATDYAALSLSASRSFTNVWPVPADSHASVRVYALFGVDEYESGEEIEVTAQNSGHDRYAVYYADGCTSCAVKIVVTAENGTNKTAYTLVLTKEDNADASALPLAKAQAVLALNDYKDATAYREEQQKELFDAIIAGKDAIEKAETAESVANVLAETKAVLDAIKTDAQLTQEETLTAIVLHTDALTLKYKGTAVLQVSAVPSTAQTGTIVWSSSDERVATVDENGIVTAKGKGTAVITASTEDGALTAECTVTVKYTFLDVIVAFFKTLFAKIIPHSKMFILL